MEDKHLDSVEVCLKKSPELKKEDLNHLKEWLNKQPHLPHLNERQLIPFLHSCYYSLEKAKKTIEAHFTIRTHAPEFFANRDPFSTELQNISNLIYAVITPKKDADGNRICVSKVKDPDYSKYIYEDGMKLCIMLLETFVHEDPTVPGFVFVLDMNGTTLGHIMKPTISSVKKFLTFVQQGLAIRMKKVHIINTTPLADTAMTLVKPFLNKELINLMQFHTGDLQNFYQYVPKSLLPKDFGGELQSLEEMHSECKRKMESYQSWFLETDKLIVDESKRTGQSKDQATVFGVEGSFKKLDID